MMIERRFITHEFRLNEADQAPAIQGYAAVFDSPASNGMWTESLDPHCFDKVLASSPDVRALWNHNADFVLGRTTAKTLSLGIDARGLSYSIDPPNTSVANDLMISMRRKDVTGSSFGFVVARDQWTDMPDGTISRRILEIDTLLDVSPVTYPFYDAANSQVRSLPESMPKEMRSKVEMRSKLEDPCKPASLNEHEAEWRENTRLRLALAAL